MGLWPCSSFHIAYWSFLPCVNSIQVFHFRWNVFYLILYLNPIVRCLPSIFWEMWQRMLGVGGRKSFTAHRYNFVWMTWILLFLQQLYKRSYIWTQPTNLENIFVFFYENMLEILDQFYGTLKNVTVLLPLLNSWWLYVWTPILKDLTVFPGICQFTFVQMWRLFMTILWICWSTAFPKNEICKNTKNPTIIFCFFLWLSLLKVNNIISFVFN